MQNNIKQNQIIPTKNPPKSNKKSQKKVQKQQAKIKQKKVPKLRMKTDEEIKIIQQFYHKYCNCWTTQQIRELSDKIGMKYGQVYKYLWDLKNRSKKKKKVDDFLVEEKASQSYNMVKQEQSEFEADQQQKLLQLQQEQPVLHTKTVLVQRITLEYPTNLKFANEFVILDHQKIPCQITNLLQLAGSSLFLEDNEDNQDMSQIDQQAGQDIIIEQYQQDRVQEGASHQEQNVEEEEQQISDQIKMIKQQQIYQEEDDDHHNKI